MLQFQIFPTGYLLEFGYLSYCIQHVALEEANAARNVFTGKWSYRYANMRPCFGADFFTTVALLANGFVATISVALCGFDKGEQT